MAKRFCSSDLSPSASASLSSSSNWSFLPKDLLDLIIDKLTSLPDIARLCAVCKSWNSIALDRKREIKKLINHPWQVVINSTPKQKQLQLLNFANSEFCEFQLRYPFDEEKICKGSSHGWLVFEKEFESERFQVILLNPLSGKIIDLPPIKRCSRFSEIGKVVLSRDPCLGSFQVLVNFHNCFSKAGLAHLEFGDEFWSYFDWDDYELGPLSDITMHKNWIIGASFQGRIVCLHVDHDIRCIKFKQEVVPNFSSKFYVLSYFVETANGHLLVVHRVDDFDNPYSVYKLGYSNGEFKRIHVKSLGDHSLFLGIHHSALVLASKHSGLGYKSNTIYCSYASVERSAIFQKTYRVEEFNMEDQTKKEDRRRYFFSSDTSWIVPSMNF